MDFWYLFWFQININTWSFVRLALTDYVIDSVTNKEYTVYGNLIEELIKNILNEFHCMVSNLFHTKNIDPIEINAGKFGFKLVSPYCIIHIFKLINYSF